MIVHSDTSQHRSSIVRDSFRFIALTLILSFLISAALFAMTPSDMDTEDESKWSAHEKKRHLLGDDAEGIFWNEGTNYISKVVFDGIRFVNHGNHYQYGPEYVPGDIDKLTDRIRNSQ